MSSASPFSSGSAIIVILFFLLGVSAKHLSDDVSTTVSQNATTGSATFISAHQSTHESYTMRNWGSSSMDSKSLIPLSLPPCPEQFTGQPPIQWRAMTGSASSTVNLWNDYFLICLHLPLYLCIDMSLDFSLQLMHIQLSRLVMGLVQNCYMLWEKQEVLLLSQENKKDGWQGWILHFKFYFQCISSPTLLSLLGVLDLYNCIIHIPGNTSLYSANHSGPNICNQLTECVCRCTLSCVFYFI